jgi:predicted transcriptional regulator YdeE
MHLQDLAMKGDREGVKTMEPKSVQKDEMLVMGVEVRTTNLKEASPTTAEISKLWQRFFQEQLLKQIPNKINPGVILGVYTDYENNQDGEFSLIIASEVSSIDNPPESMVGITIPAAEYLVFSGIGELPNLVIQVWKEIWEYFSTQVEYRRAYTTDFELYEKQDKVDIYIAVKKA